MASISDIMKSSFGEVSNKLNVTYKKTILVRQYETEVIEAETEIVLDKEVTGAERIFITAIMRAQMEYQVYCDLFFKKQVTQTEYNERVAIIEQEITWIKQAAEGVIGRSLDEYITCKELNMTGDK